MGKKYKEMDEGEDEYEDEHEEESEDEEEGEEEEVGGIELLSKIENKIMKKFARKGLDDKKHEDVLKLAWLNVREKNVALSLIFGCFGYGRAQPNVCERFQLFILHVSIYFFVAVHFNGLKADYAKTHDDEHSAFVFIWQKLLKALALMIFLKPVYLLIRRLFLKDLETTDPQKNIGIHIVVSIVWFGWLVGAVWLMWSGRSVALDAGKHFVLIEILLIVVVVLFVDPLKSFCFGFLFGNYVLHECLGLRRDNYFVKLFIDLS